jgi:hypothetical protein
VRTLKNTAKALLATAILAVPTLSANAVTEERFFLFWNDWQGFGVLGSDVVVGQLDGGLPNLDHIAWNGATIWPIVYPIFLDANNDPIDDRQFFYTSHATATLGAVGARNPSFGNSPLGPVLGWAPESTMLVGGYGSRFSLTNGTVVGFNFTGMYYSLMMMTDQAFANAAIDDYRQYWQDYVDRYTDGFGVVFPPASALHPNFTAIQPYRVATVVNLPFTQGGDDNSLTGANLLSNILNIVATGSQATFIAAAGNEGDNPDLEDNDPNYGSVLAPATAANVIAVGFTETGRQGQRDDDSSQGPSGYRDRRVDFNLIPPDFPTLGEIPSESPLERVRSGVDIVAPGVELELPGSFTVNALDNTAFIKGWTGSSMSSSIVTGAVALLHDIHRKRYFAFNPSDPDGEFSPRAVLPPLVTRAILLNSANREQGFNAAPAPGGADNIQSTSSPLDDQLGAGRLDMRRLLNQYLATPSLGGYQDLKAGDSRILAKRRRQTFTDPTDPALASENTYALTDIDGEPILFAGTDPSVASITTFRFPGQEEGRPGGLRDALASGTTSKSNTPSSRKTNSDAFTSLSDIIHPSDSLTRQAQLIPPGDDDTDFGSNSGGLGSPGSVGLTGGDTEVVGGGASGGGGGGFTGNINPSAPIGVLYSAGWDHGMLGTGELDIPMGLITEGSSISVTLTWNEHMVIDSRLVDLIRDSLNPTNLRAASDAQSNDIMHRAASMGVPVPELGSQDALELLFPGAKKYQKTSPLDPASFKPSVMGGYKVSPTNPPPGFDPAFNDDLDSFFDPTTNIGRVDKAADGTLNPVGSAFAGVCYIEATIRGREVSFTGVAISNEHVLTAAHNLDTDNDALINVPDISQLTITFHGIDTDNNGIGETIRYTKNDLHPDIGVRVHPDYRGVGQIPFGPNLGFSSDLVLLTLDLNDGVNDFFALNIPFYSPSVFTQTTKLPGFELLEPGEPGYVPNDPIDVIMVGYGASGYANEGLNEASFPENGLVRRIGWNQFNDNNWVIEPGALGQFVTVFEYDFDGPPAIYGEGPLNDGLTLGNRLESIHTFGDSGGPMFEWQDSNFNGIIEWPELKIFGLNTALSNGTAPSVDQFGAAGRGVVLNPYANTAMDNWINLTLNEGPPPPLPGAPTEAVIRFNENTFAIQDLFEWELENLDLEIWRTSGDGSGFRQVAASTGEWFNTELIYIQSDPELVRLGEYFARIKYTQSMWDFGGFIFEQGLVDGKLNERQIPYVDLFEADTEYGFAFYVDLIRDVDIFGTREVSSRSADGSYTTGTEYYLKKTFKDFMGDMNADADIDGEDLGEMLALWGQKGTPGETRGDLDANGVVDIGDLAILLRNYTGSRDEE